MGNHTYMSTVATSLKFASPGCCMTKTPWATHLRLPLTTSSVVAGRASLIVDKHGGFSATVGSAGDVDVVIGQFRADWLVVD
jgi:hypothetical protein